MGTINSQPHGHGGRPGQAGFVKRGGTGARGASRSSPQLILPSFSPEEDNDDDDDNDNSDNEGDNDTEDKEVDFPNQGNVQRRRQTVQGGKQPRNPIAAKNLNLIRAPKCGKNGFAEIAAWNRPAHQGAWNETKRGWMVKTE